MDTKVLLMWYIFKTGREIALLEVSDSNHIRLTEEQLHSSEPLLIIRSSVCTFWLNYIAHRHSDYKLTMIALFQFTQFSLCEFCQAPVYQSSFEYQWPKKNLARELLSIYLKESADKDKRPDPFTLHHRNLKTHEPIIGPEHYHCLNSHASSALQEFQKQVHGISMLHVHVP